MINLDQNPYCIRRDFVNKYKVKACTTIEEQYCELIGRPVSPINTIKLWKNASLQDKQAVHTIMDYERAYGKTN